MASLNPWARASAIRPARQSSNGSSAAYCPAAGTTSTVASAAASASPWSTGNATQRCLNPGFSEKIGNSRRTGLSPNEYARRTMTTAADSPA